uniref:Inhibitor I9 domain-containing protein n=1 Tax=Ananas comosus var. bracteatus TaxID=296719 RepID=A0A6V7NJW3_ANACO|nr:unnamed protein product [Ananas comosus var. bracteatus]
MEINQIISSTFTHLSFIFVFLFISSPVLSRPNIGVPSNAGINESEQLRTYIVRVQPPTEVADAGSTELESWYKSFLSESISDAGELRLVHSYSEVFVGFAAQLTKTELNSIQKKEGFVHAFPVKNLRLLTTRTPAFLGLQPGTGLWNTTALSRGIIIGLLDTGIAPTHPSFSDDGVPPPPAKWKGSCAFETGCNNKLIGAQSFVQDDKSPFDDIGHGTHTASTAAGNFVHGASAFGQASGTAAGWPRTHTWRCTRSAARPVAGPRIFSPA